MSQKNDFHRESRFTYVLNVILLLLITVSVVYFVVERPDWSPYTEGTVVEAKSEKVDKTAKPKKTDSKTDKAANKEITKPGETIGNKAGNTAKDGKMDPKENDENMVKYIDVRLNSFDIIAKGSTPKESEEYLESIKKDIDGLPEGKDKAALMARYEDAKKVREEAVNNNAASTEEAE